MAKFGEGDKRWIVEDRADGANVHHWHWAEKDCLPWAKKRLGELLQNVPILEGSGGLWISTTKLDSVTGEAYVNIRKGKIIPGYELTVSLSWKGEAKDGQGNSLAQVTGRVEMPYVADENADEDPELKVSVLDEGAVGQRLREAFLATGKSMLLERVAKFVKEMKEGGPAKDELEGKLVPKAASAGGKAVKTDAKIDSSSPAPSKQPAPKAKDKEGFKTIALTERFHCRPHDIYTTLLDENRWKGFTQSKAKISNEIGGQFFIFDGAVTGVNMKLEEDKLIMQKWRFQNWHDGQYSTVCLTIEEPEIGVTVVKLTQTDVPEEDRYGNATVVENTQKGWKDLIFHKIRAVFGYGL
ncbi:hypothetical protein GOP47_0006158 [Adiantum capillus-veneris]|uniref:Activator of Hsp90 ATPase AHSA1-like N-terminal domain-containing protein n=1 Tax=Adiantum capillus-veneris TaxID=13818 RepID=A0A9D4ZLS1_ADICA|nr:hypothetical protein GOP47_0006158 [Adiantum capillus-veneris]